MRDRPGYLMAGLRPSAQPRVAPRRSLSGAGRGPSQLIVPAPNSKEGQAALRGLALLKSSAQRSGATIAARLLPDKRQLSLEMQRLNGTPLDVLALNGGGTSPIVLLGHSGKMPNPCQSFFDGDGFCGAPENMWADFVKFAECVDAHVNAAVGKDKEKEPLSFLLVLVFLVLWVASRECEDSARPLGAPCGTKDRCGHECNCEQGLGCHPASKTCCQPGCWVDAQSNPVPPNTAGATSAGTVGAPCGANSGGCGENCGCNKPDNICVNGLCVLCDEQFGGKGVGGEIPAQRCHPKQCPCPPGSECSEIEPGFLWVTTNPGPDAKWQTMPGYIYEQTKKNDKESKLYTHDSKFMCTPVGWCKSDKGCK